MSQQNEITPLAPTTAAGGNAGSATSDMILNAASSVFTKENAAKAGSYVKDKAHHLSDMMKEGNYSIRLMAMLGALCMVATSATGIIGRVLSLHFVSAVIAFYTLLLGCIIVILEGRWLPVPKSWEAKLYHYALFLKYIWGRGCLYFIAGSLQFSQLNLVDSLVGGFMMFVGIIYIIVGKSTANKLSTLRKEMYTEDELKMRFYKFDAGKEGHLDHEEFRQFMESLGLQMNRAEYLTAFSFIDADQGGKIEFEEFLRWWNEWDFDSFEDVTFMA